MLSLRKLLFLFGRFLVRSTEVYVYTKKPFLKDRLIIPEDLTGKIVVVDDLRKTVMNYTLEKGLIVHGRFENTDN